MTPLATSFVIPEPAPAVTPRPASALQERRIASRWPCYDEDEIAAVVDVLRSGRVNGLHHGEQTATFESAFATLCDMPHGVAVANGTEYGLAAGIWTSDIGRALRLSKAVKSGQVFVNNYGAAGGVELPFGGVKGSGHGREKGFEALYGFGAMKMIAIKHGV